jgi:hypothetical protein
MKDLSFRRIQIFFSLFCYCFSVALGNFRSHLRIDLSVSNGRPISTQARSQVPSGSDESVHYCHSTSQINLTVVDSCGRKLGTKGAAAAAIIQRELQQSAADLTRPVVGRKTFSVIVVRIVRRFGVCSGLDERHPKLSCNLTRVVWT